MKPHRIFFSILSVFKTTHSKYNDIKTLSYATIWLWPVNVITTKILTEIACVMILSEVLSDVNTNWMELKEK